MKLIDLSHPLSCHMPVYPGTPAPAAEPLYTMERHGFRETALRLTSHTGTHMDAPAHMLPHGKELDQYDASAFAGRGFVLDCWGQHAITKEMLLRHEMAIRRCDWLLFYTGWDAYWGSERYFSGFPVLTAEAAELAAHLGLKGVGEDCISLDPCGDPSFPNHMTILGSGLLNVENLQGLGPLAGREFTFLALPLPLPHADGAPCRAAAILN